MQRCKVRFSLPGRVEIKIQAGEEETAEDLLSSLAEGKAPTWLEDLIFNSLRIEDIDIEDVRILGDHPDLEEPLDFDF